MSRLGDRLRRMERGAAGERAPERISDLRRRLDRVLGPGRVVPACEVPPPPTAPVERFVAGERLPTASGTVFVTEWVAPLDHCHGRVRVEELAALHQGGAKTLFEEYLGDIDAPEEVAFLDTETTGLAGGAGTVPFLVGLGRWRGDTFRVTQLFLEDLDREPALLEVLTRELQGVRCLVTYNGRSFDLPLLENRHVLNRCDWPLRHCAHLDLLPPSRTLWRHGQPNCRLATLERSILGFEREGDIPGSEIPSLYQRFLRRGATPRLAAVFRHNRDDIVSLAGLLWAAGRAAEGEGGSERAGAGLLLARKGKHRKACGLLAGSLDQDLPAGLRWRALRELSLVHKRSGDWSKALAAWEEMRRLAPSDPFALEEAAKALEHRLSDTLSALHLVEQALASGLWTPSDRRALERRHRRLARKASNRETEGSSNP